MDNLMTGIGGDAPFLLRVLWGLTTITLIFVLLRLYTRLQIINAYGLDDHVFNLAFATLLIFDIIMTVSCYYGFGRDMEGIIATKGVEAGMEAVTRAILWSAVGHTVIICGTWLSKLSLALFLYRLGSTSRERIVVWVPCFFLGTGIVASLSIFWLSCQPFQYFWDRRIEGRCLIHPAPMAIYAGAWSVITDFWYAGFPWYLMWNSQLPLHEKWMVAGSMSLGIFAGACGIARAVELRHLGSPNYLGDTVSINIWHAAELSTTMICISIPVCRPMYKVCIDRITSRWVHIGRGRNDLREQDDMHVSMRDDVMLRRVTHPESAQAEMRVNITESGSTSQDSICGV